MKPNELDRLTTEPSEPRIASQNPSVITMLIQDWFKRHLSLGSQVPRLDPKADASVETSGWGQIHSNSNVGERVIEEDETSENPTPSLKPGPIPESIDDKPLIIDAPRIPFAVLSRLDGVRQGQSPADEPMLVSRPELSELVPVAEVRVKSTAFVADIPRFSTYQRNLVEQAGHLNSSVNTATSSNEQYSGPASVVSIPIGDQVESSRRDSFAIDKLSHSENATLSIGERNEPSAFIVVSRRPMNNVSQLDLTPLPITSSETAIDAELSRNAGPSLTGFPGQELEQSIERLLSVLDQVLRGERASFATGRRRFPLN